MNAARCVWYRMRDRLIVAWARVLSTLGFTVCQGCWGPCCRLGKRRRQNTRYANDAMNWVVMCDVCAEQNDARWQERWDEFYAGRVM